MKLLSGSNNTFRTIGMMSGTSLDGLDIAAVEFTKADEKWQFELIDATTVSYSQDWEELLKNAPQLSGEQLTKLDFEYGKFLGEQAGVFIRKSSFAVDFIASHGHTVFHRPESGYTLQIGSGAKIVAVTGLPVVADFRTADVALGGQGAPLVPIGDKLLFSDYDYCLNLGGFANISFEENNDRIAFDIGPANIVLNEMVREFGVKYDKDGELGRQGKIDFDLLKRLNDLEFYRQQEPKSLGREWIEEVFLPLLTKSNSSFLDKLRTVYEHIAVQITNVLNGNGRMLVTGGGALNCFLMERIQELTTTEVCLPEKKIIEYKEAIIFSFLGLLRFLDINNCLASVTGASKDHSGGVIFWP